MTNNKAEKWLEEREIKLDESFPMALKRMAKSYQKANGIKNIEDVYYLIGLKKQYVAYWTKNPNNIQSKKLSA